MAEVALIDEAARKRDVGDGHATVVQHGDGVFHPAAPQVFARGAAVTAAERARQVDRMDIDGAGQFAEPRCVHPLVVELFARTGGENTAFSLSQPKGFKPGTYKVVVLLDDDSVDTKVFVVKK